ncbi:MAG TPA: hypothetical protein VMS08_06230 [Candidatus Saccharimonadia bacterium]|nr:hypothetical protein [Candidatus Saccharimonadia bacterium]
MAIALVQKSTVGEFAGTISAACTLTGVTSGNTLLLLVSHANFDATGGGVTASDAQGAYSADQEIEGSRYSCDILRLSLANAGTHLATSTAKFGTGANSYGQAILTEWSGLSALDQVAGNSSAASTGPVSTGATAALATSSDLAVSIACAGAAETGWGTPSGYTSIYQDLTNNNLATSIAYLVLSSSSGVTSNFGMMGGSTAWVAINAAYMPTVSGSGENGAQMMIGMGR